MNELHEIGRSLLQSTQEQPEEDFSLLSASNFLKGLSSRNNSVRKPSNRPFSDGTLDEDAPKLPEKVSHLVPSQMPFDFNSSEFFFQKFSSAVNLLDGERSTPLHKLAEDAQDYDDLPSEHKPILPPKTLNQSMAELGTTKLDPIQLALHRHVMSKSACSLPITTTKTRRSDKKKLPAHDPTDYDEPIPHNDFSQNEMEDYDEPICHNKQ